MVISFSTGVLLFKWIQSFQHSQDHLSVSQHCSFHLPQVAFVFPALPPFFFKESDVLTKYPFYWCKVSPFLFRQCSYPVILRKILMELQVLYSSIFSSAVDSIQALLIIFLSSFQGFLMPAQFLIVHLSISDCPGVLNISQKARLFIQDQFNLFRGCYLIQLILIQLVQPLF